MLNDPCFIDAHTEVKVETIWSLFKLFFFFVFASHMFLSVWTNRRCYCLLHDKDLTWLVFISISVSLYHCQLEKERERACFIYLLHKFSFHLSGVTWAMVVRCTSTLIWQTMIMDKISWNQKQNMNKTTQQPTNIASTSCVRVSNDNTIEYSTIILTFWVKFYSNR